jgi:hypothetical protein
LSDVEGLTVVYGPRILVRSLSLPGVRSKGSPNAWQYHSRSDRHSKIACWGILFDLLSKSDRLRRQARSGDVVFGVNHEMVDFRNNRKKKLDLVLCSPRGQARGSSFMHLVDRYGIVLDAQELDLAASLPGFLEGPVGMVRVALEAKACMTEHVKALPRLHDELNSSHLTVHGAANHAIAVGFSMINASTRFISSDRNKHDLGLVPPTITTHTQPKATDRVLQKLREIPRRTRPAEEGFDAFGVVVVELVNDGSPVRLLTSPPAPEAGDIFDYEAMIDRTVDLYHAHYL